MPVSNQVIKCRMRLAVGMSRESKSVGVGWLLIAPAFHCFKLKTEIEIENFGPLNKVGHTGV